jgi:hypothetical protein
MPGYNHFADCTCGWCLKLASSVASAPAPRTTYHRRQFGTYQSFLNPNATCPVCSERVFYYESPFGGRVFFDELGPPWPKHGCTSSTPEAHRPKMVSQSSRPAVAEWRTRGWQPLNIIRRYKEDDWWVIGAILLSATERPLRLLFDGEPPLRPKMMAQFNGWDAEGYGFVSYLDDEAQPHELWAFSYADHVFEVPHAATLLRQVRGQPL